MMVRHLRTMALSGLLLAAAPAIAQKGLTWALSGHYGQILKHTPKIAFDIPEVSAGVDLNLIFQTYGRFGWHEHQNYPLIGISAQYYHLGDPEVLGSVLGIVPNLNLRLLEKKYWGLRFQTGTGLGVVTRPYNRISNPTNNAIGSGLNNITTFRLEAHVRLHPSWQLTLGGSFTHFSNAAAKMPNLGINVPAIAAGLAYTPQPLGPDDYEPSPVSKKPDRRWGAMGYGGVAFKETRIPGGPKKMVYFASLAGQYRISRTNHLSVGMAWEYHQSIYQFLLHTYTATTEEEARRGATRLMPFVSDEFLFGRFGIFVQAGFYLGGQSRLIPYPIHNKLGLRYYFPPMGPQEASLFAGIHLKSHLITAEFVGWSLGLRW